MSALSPHTCVVGIVLTELYSWPNSLDLDFLGQHDFKSKLWKAWTLWHMSVILALGRVEAGRSGIEGHRRLYVV